MNVLQLMQPPLSQSVRPKLYICLKQVDFQQLLQHLVHAAIQLNSGTQHIFLRQGCLSIPENLACDISKFYTSVGDDSSGGASGSSAASPSSSISVSDIAQKACDPDLVNTIIDETGLGDLYDQAVSGAGDLENTLGAQPSPRTAHNVNDGGCQCV